MKTEKSDFLGTATYCPEDNKLRFYPDARLDAQDYDRIKKAGFKWAPKQGLFVKPKWGPIAEDLMLEWCDIIEDEDKSPEDRAADRAERFAMYRDKRAAEAHTYADCFESGPSVHGYQSEKRAQAAANKHDKQRVNAFTQWDKAEYWQTRTAGVISNALHKAKPEVRRSRILKLEAEQRKHEKELEKAEFIFRKWKQVLTLDEEKAFKLAENLSNYSYCYDYQHPRTDKKSSLWSLLTDKENPVTGHEAASLYLKRCLPEGPKQEDSFKMRYSRHYELRLSYERQMLDAEGGTAATVEMEPGGFIGKYQIKKVNRSPITKMVVSVSVEAPHAWIKNSDGTPAIRLQTLNIQRCSKHVYTPPTEEQRKLFKAEQSEEKKIKKAKNAGAPKLINPTREAAERLQRLWNDKAEKGYLKYLTKKGMIDRPGLNFFKPSEILELTQAQYSANSNGAFARFQSVGICHDGLEKGVSWDKNDAHRSISCKVRKAPSNGSYSFSAYRVIIITDKPQKPLPEFKEYAKESLVVV